MCYVVLFIFISGMQILKAFESYLFIIILFISLETFSNHIPLFLNLRADLQAQKCKIVNIITVITYPLVASEDVVRSEFYSILYVI